MSAFAVQTLLLVPEFLALGVAAFGVSYGAFKILRMFEVSSSMKD
jgi:hypothetical protein